MKKFKKIFTKVFCILLASLLLVMSPVSKYFDTQRIDKVEASAGAVIGGLGVLYIICHTLGYDIGTIHAPTIKEEVVNFASDLFRNNSITYQELMGINGLLANDKFAETIALKTIIAKLYEVLNSYLESKEYDETSGVHQLAQDRYTYNHLPRTYDTVCYSEKYNNATVSKGHTRLITAYDCNTDCYYSASIASLRDNEYIAVLNDGLFYLTFDSSNNLEYIYDFNTNHIFGWKNDGSSYSDYTKDVYDGSLSITGSQLADIIRSGYQIYSDRFLGIINTSSSNLVSGTDTISTIQSQRISDYSVPSDLDIIRHGVTDVTFPERIANSEYDLTTSQASAIANAYSEAYSSSTGQSISARYPTTDRTKVEDNIIADVYPVVDRTFSDTNTGDNTDSDDGTDVGTDTETEELIQFLSALLSGFGIYISYDWLTDGNNAKELEETIEENYEEVRLQVVSSGSPLHDDDDDEDNDIDIDKIVDFATFKGKIMESQTFNMNEAFQNGAMSIILTFISGIITQIIADNISDEVIWVHPDIEQTFENEGVLEVAPPSKAWVFPSADTMTEMQEGFDLPQTELTPEIKHGYIGDFIEETGSEPIFHPQTYPSYNPVVNPDVEPDDSPNTDEDPDIDENLSFWEKLWEWLKKIWQALINILSKLGLLDVLNYILNAINQIGELLSNLFGNVSLLDILNAIFNLPSNIASVLLNALGSLLETLFVPDTVALEATLNEFGGKFPWIPKLFGYAKNIRATLQSSVAPPAVYADFSKSENSNYHPIGKVKVLDVSWYAQYKPSFDLYMSGFLWLFFIWKVLKNLPNIISGGGMVVEDHAQYEYQQAKNFGSAKNGKFRKG